MDGSVIHATIDGTHVAEFHTVDGAPVEGYVGFASSFGAYQVVQPIVERLDRNRVAGRSVAERKGLDFARRGKGTLEHYLARSCAGLPPSSTGTLLLWIGPAPRTEDGSEFDADALFADARPFVMEAGRRAAIEEVTQPFVLAVPEAAGQERIAAYMDGLAKELGRRPTVVRGRRRYDTQVSSAARRGGGRAGAAARRAARRPASCICQR